MLAHCKHCRSPVSRPRAAAVSRNVEISFGRSKRFAQSHRRVLVRAVPDVDESSFEAEVSKADVPVVVEFWADWCGPCKLVTPLLDKLQAEAGESLKVVKIECDGNPSLVEQYGIIASAIYFTDDYIWRNGIDVRDQGCFPSVVGVLTRRRSLPDKSSRMQVYGLPTLILFRNGEEVPGSKREGAIAMAGIKSWLSGNDITV